MAEEFQSEAVLSTEALRRAIQTGLGTSGSADVARARRVRSDLGFLWGTSPTPGWEPGIPSLMEYVVQFAPAP